MPERELIQRLHRAAGQEPPESEDAESLIGIFQMFRPDGRAIRGLFEGLESGLALEQRLAQLYQAAGDDRRPQGGRDAYFVVRRPPLIAPTEVERLAQDWLAQLAELASCLGDVETATALGAAPAVRILEGIPPKHPKDEREKSNLLKTFQQDATVLVERIDTDPVAAMLRPAFYFTACDAMLRDYLMWPLYVAATGLDDPFASYFQLWRHGVKYRIFGETQIDFYLPRPAGRNGSAQ